MKKALLLVATIFMLQTVIVGQTALRVKHFNLEKGIAIQGYDPVSYFQGKAVKGKKEWSASAEGIVYQFSSSSNKELFLKDYKKYEPQYGGWCAYAMGANNEKVEVDPETYKILDGKLYLFYHTWVNNTLTKWNKDEAKLKTAADANWQALYH